MPIELTPAVIDGVTIRTPDDKEHLLTIEVSFDEDHPAATDRVGLTITILPDGDFQYTYDRL